MRIDEILELLRIEQAPDMAWRRVLEICSEDSPSPLWQSLPAVDVVGDAALVRRWLEEQLRGVDGPLGLYLGLDTLNMRDGAGINLELGWLRGCDTAQDSVDWTFDELKYGSSTLIGALVALQAEYRQARWKPQFHVADYMLFLAYSGLVLSHALRGLKKREPLLAAWGFHDGDFFALCRRGPAGFEMICR